MDIRVAVGGLALLLAAGGVVAQPVDALHACADMIREVGAPRYLGDDPPPHTLLCRSGYLLSHNDDTKIPDWEIEDLTPARFVGPGDRDHSSFVGDPTLTQAGKPHSVDDDYKGSGFDRGHMAPAADMKPDQAMMDESHYLSNIAPQVGLGFNRGIWARLEDAIRVWTEHRGHLIAMTGPIYDDTDRKMRGTDIPVPPRFYKIVYEPARHRAIAFIFPNRKITDKDLGLFIATIDDIEQATGIDFLPGLSKSIQKRIERNVSSLWVQ
ncbi:MAG TPA: DNA/RNA non-specific endonuclease [Steroidobacteraceae bacterium]|nr:DNA/RNA non-specific endonuclease [Steroidobacteraceae bacterium]